MMNGLWLVFFISFNYMRIMSSLFAHFKTFAREDCDCCFVPMLCIFEVEDVWRVPRTSTILYLSFCRVYYITVHITHTNLVFVSLKVGSHSTVTETVQFDNSANLFALQ